MRMDFTNVEDVSYVSVPEGTYLCRIDDVREKNTRDGSPRWSYRLIVMDGEFAGRTAAWDSVAWTERGMGRCKHVLKQLGFDVSGVIEVEAGDLVGLCARVKIEFEEHQDPNTDIRSVRPSVPFFGYEAAQEDEPRAWGA
ncbi:MAG: hypothetical protein ACI8TQ_002887 [Planctomycetota bacterium]|jgi:hypothetical protein